jgi:hypothetical protein
LELVKCTARSGDTLTIVRAQESTSAAGFTAGAAVELRLTAGVLTELHTNMQLKATVTVDFGSVGQYGLSTTVTVAGAVTGQAVLVGALPPDQGDELEMDAIVGGGVVTATDTVALYLQAVPGPVQGTRSLRLLIGG